MSLIEIYRLPLLLFNPKFNLQQQLTLWKSNMKHFLILLLALSPLNFVYAEEDYSTEPEYYDESSSYEGEESSYEDDSYTENESDQKTTSILSNN